MSDLPIDELPLLNPPEFPHCLVCGPANPDGLHLDIHRDGTDAVARYTPKATQIGYPERVHGGLIGMLVDEMLGMTHPLDLVGWRFQGTDDDEVSRMFDIRRFGTAESAEWGVVRVYD